MCKVTLLKASVLRIFIILLLILFFVAAAGFVGLLKYLFLQSMTQPRRGGVMRNDKILAEMTGKADKVLSGVMFAQLWLCCNAFAFATIYILPYLNGLNVFVYVLLTLIFGWLAVDLWPKAYAKRRPALLVDTLIPWLDFIQTAFYPFAKILGFMMHMIGGRSHRATNSELVNATDLSGFVNTTMNRSTEKSSVWQTVEALMVRDAVVPLVEMPSIDAATPIDDILAQVFAGKAQRLLMIQDSPDNIVGILHTRLLMSAFCQADGDRNALDITSAISEPVVIDAETPLLTQINAFLQRHEHFALVRDRNGGIIGATSLERLFETLGR